MKLTKAQLKAKQIELNRQIWESAYAIPFSCINSAATDPYMRSENPSPQWYPERNTVPVQAPFKPNVTLLSRKPTPQVLSRNAMANLNLDDDDDSEEERRKKAAADFEERKIRAQKERAEKERKYAEARERIFGSPAVSEDSRSNSPSKPARGGKGKGRSGRDSAPRTREQSPARAAAVAGATKQLYDPTYTPKPGSVFLQKKELGDSRPATPHGQEKPVRQPQGPAKDGAKGFAWKSQQSAVGGPS